MQPYPPQHSFRRKIRAFKSSFALALAVHGVLIAGFVPHSDGQILRYDFNEGTGTTSSNYGSAGNAGDLGFGGASGWTSGVEGSAYDAAPSNEANTYATTAGTVSGLDNLSGFTITGWLNTNVWFDELVVMSWKDGSAGAALQLRTTGELALFLEPWWDSNVTVSSTDGQYAAVDGWLFFAVSWDGSGETTDKVNFYLGGEDLTASLVSTANRGGATTTGVSSQAFMLGQSSTLLENWWTAYQGSMDDIRVYGSVLDLAAIQGIQAEAVPEPGAIALGALALGALSCGRRRRSRLD
jgi:hypothetical protein